MFYMNTCIKIRINTYALWQFQGSSLRCFWMVYQSAGVRGLYWGILPRLLRVTAEQAVTFSLFDLVARQLDLLPWP